MLYSFITGSYDRTCKVWQTETGCEVYTLEGHRNVVYAIAFNLPFSGNSIYVIYISSPLNVTKVFTHHFISTPQLWITKGRSSFVKYYLLEIDVNLSITMCDYASRLLLFLKVTV